MSKTQETTLEISLQALAHNYKYLRSRTSPVAQFMGVVKAFAYGSDAVRIAEKLILLGVDFLAVSYIQEGVHLRLSGIKKPILVFNPLPHQYDLLIKNNLIPTLYSFLTLNRFIMAAEAAGVTGYPVHLNLNTGMNRLGFNADELKEVTTTLQKNTFVKLAGVYSHLVASEDPGERDFTLQQYTKFKSMSDRLCSSFKHPVIRHLCNTSGILNYPEAHLDMVRAGIGLYGFGNSAEEDKNLIPVGRLKTIISQLHTLKKGESVGYNRRFTAEKTRKIATLPLGYADGLHRLYGNNKTQVSINGKTAPIVGNICMGMTMVDVTGIDCREGDEVILFDQYKSAGVMAQKVGTISYELITCISARVKRKITDQ